MRILATDLDGTFLGGSDAARAALARHFASSPDRRLLYVTGRSSRSVIALVAQGRLPRPDAMICDVGSYVATAEGDPARGAVMDYIEATWGDRGERVRAAFAELPGLRLQPDFGPFRVSYYFDATAELTEAHATADALGCDGLVSDNLYFDVLPRGVNKGSTLARLMQEWNVPPESVLVAGDTLNDLAMLAAGFPAVVVANAEPALLTQLPPSNQILRASAAGCDGIIEALRARGVEVSDA